MSDANSPRTYGVTDSGRKPLWIVIALLVCVILALVAYIFTQPGAPPAVERKPTPAPAPAPAPVMAGVPPPVTTPAPAPAPVLAPAAANPQPAKTPEAEAADARLSFRFNYLDKPAQWRDWRRISATQWEEVEPNGNATRFLVIGRLNDAKMKGTMVRRISDQKMDVFIPDKKSSRMMYWRYAPEGEWVYMGQVSAEAALPDGGEF